MQFVEIEWQGELYADEIKLRDKLLRAPLGLTFSDDELAEEAKQLHFGMVDDETLIACAVIVPLSASLGKLRQMAVATSHQGRGIGTQLIGHIERELAGRGFRAIELNARVEAIGFYERLGYDAHGDEFVEVTIPHRKMKKVMDPEGMTA